MIFTTGIIGEGNIVTVSGDGNIVSVGTNVEPRSVRVFEYHKWTPLGTFDPGQVLMAPSSQSSDGNTIATSDPGYNSGAGAVIVLRLNSWIQWEQLGSVLTGDPSGGRFGWSTSLSDDGNRLAVGEIDFSNGKGYVQVFEWDSTVGDWNECGSRLLGQRNNDRFGVAVALSADGNALAVGESRYDGNDPNTGRVKNFAWDATLPSNGIWIQRGQFLYGGRLETQFGNFLSLSADGTILAIAERGTNHFVSRVVVYFLNGSSWTVRGTIINGSAIVDLASRVTLSSDGNTLATEARNVNGSCRIRLFQWDGSLYEQLGGDLNGGDENDQFGRSFSLSADGNTLAVGALGADYVLVYVRDMNTNTFTQLGSGIIGEGNIVTVSGDGNIVSVGTNVEPRSVRVFEYHK